MREAWAASVLFEPSLEPGLKAGLRLRERVARAEAAEDLHQAGGALEEVLVVDAGNRLRVPRGGKPEGGDRTDVDAVEFPRGHTDYRRGVLVDQDLAADDIRRGAELRLPEIGGENDDRAGAGRGIVFGFDDAAERGTDAKSR
jgi:hypothetical protein